MESWIYRLYCTKSQDSGHALLYVGISDSPSSRMGNHESQKWWWWLVDKVEWHRCSDRQEAARLESEAIANETPLFNKSQSQMCAWDRLRDIVYLLWAHESNSWMHPLCPFCDSHGNEEILHPDGPCEIFVRNDDDKLVIHFPVSCGLHGEHPIQWGVHVKVSKFLLGFGKVPLDEIAALFKAASESGQIPWESRARRIATLAEAVEAGSLAQRQSAAVALIEAK